MIELPNMKVKQIKQQTTTYLAGILSIAADGLRTIPVTNFQDIEERIAEGTKNRTIASTNMNATSSRAHTIVAVTFVQKAKNDLGQVMAKTSVINLVDLAGRYVHLLVQMDHWALKSFSYACER